MSHPYSYKIDSYKKIFQSTHVYKTTLPFVFDRSEEINKDVWIKGKVYLSLSERMSSVNLKIIFFILCSNFNLSAYYELLHEAIFVNLNSLTLSRVHILLRP